MDIKYTPGPWEFCNENTCLYHPVSSNIQDCILHCASSINAPNMANAQLIATAPELLEILKMIIEYDETTPLRKPYTNKVYKPLTNLLRKKAKQAIAKAEGR